MKETKEKSLVDRLLEKEVEEIEISRPLEACVEDFFVPFERKNLDYQDYTTQDKQMKYFLMKRFLYTAYNNLLEMDLSVNDSGLQKVKKNLELVVEHYTDFKHQLTKPPEYKYEEVFLHRQENYVEVYKNASKMKKMSEAYRAQAKAFDGKMDEVREELQKHKKGTEEYEKLAKSYRRFNTQSTDYYYKASKLKEQVVILYEFIKEFKERYIEDFKHIYRLTGELVLNDIIDILDTLSYEFDKELWERAKASPVVVKQFRNANVMGELCSATYLKYYLKTLDESKSSETQKELAELIKYIEKFGFKEILILGHNPKSLESVQKAINEQEKNFTILTSICSSFLEHGNKVNNSDLIILFNLDKNLLIETFKQLRHIKETPLLAMLTEPSFEQIDLAGKLGFQHIHVHENNEYKKLINKIRKILS